MSTREQKEVVAHSQKKEEEQQQVLVPVEMFKTGERVEVSSNEEGFKGAWFVATIVEFNRKTKKFLVEYETLLAEDGKKPLKESIAVPFIRPIPPLESVLPPTTRFRVEDVVDAFHRDAWWCGVVKRAVVDDQFVVSFENPSEEITFRGSSLRYHLEWLDGKWIRPQFQIDGQDVGAPDTMKVRQIRSKRQRENPNIRKSGATVAGYKNSSNEKGGRSEGITNIDKDTMVLQDKISNEVHPLPHQQQLLDTKIQMTKENDGERGVDKKTKKRKGGRTPPLLKMLSSEQSTQRKRRLLLPPKKSPSTPLVQSKEKSVRRVAAVLTSPRSKLRECTDVKRQRGRTSLNRTINSEEMTKASAKDSSDTTKGEASLKAKNDKVKDDLKLSSESFCGLPTLSAEGNSSRPIMRDIDGGERGNRCKIIIAIDDVDAAADDDDEEEEQQRQKQNEEKHKKEEERQELHKKEKEIVEQRWPFEKCSPVWKTIESMQVFRKVPQKPHFSSLSKSEEEFREGLAIGYMVTFTSTVDKISKLQISDPTSLIDRYLETLAELESHGFDVETFRGCLKELLEKKARECQLQEELKKSVSEIVVHRFVKTKLEHEISENDANIKVYRKKTRAATVKKDLMDEGVVMLQSRKDQIAEDIANVRLDFEKLVATPL